MPIGPDDIDAVVDGVMAARRRDRVELFKQIGPELGAVAKALQDLPFKDAESPIKKCQDIMDMIADPLGEHFGDCQLCEDPIFVRGEPDDDVESGPEEGSHSHRTCMDRLRKTNPGLFVVADDEDGRSNDD